jgi:hypothetical protein
MDCSKSRTSTLNKIKIRVLTENTYQEKKSRRAGDVKLTSPNNYRAIRYADVLLMAAKHTIKVHQMMFWRTYLNEVRARAFGIIITI